MKANDVASGLLLLLFGIVLWAAADALPNPAQQVYGPAFFPKWVAGGLIIGALVLVGTSLDQIGKQPFFRLEPWLLDPRASLRVLLVPVLVIAYVQSIDFLGFLIAAPAVLLILFFALGVRPIVAIPVTGGVIAVVHVLFSIMLRVPLPSGKLL